MPAYAAALAVVRRRCSLPASKALRALAARAVIRKTAEATLGNRSCPEGVWQLRADGGDVAAKEASSAATALVVVVGVGAGALYVLLGPPRRQNKDCSLEEVTPQDCASFTLLRSYGAAVVCAYHGSDPRWLGHTLRVRLDDSNAALVDAAAVAKLGGSRYAPTAEPVRLGSTVAAELVRQLRSAAEGSSQSLRRAGDHGCSVGIRVADGEIPRELHKGPMIVVELRPGSGLLELYGQRSLYNTAQDDSLLRRDSIARAGGYNSRDFYSGRSDRAMRALTALAEEPQGRLRILVDGRSAFPDGGEDLQAALQELGLVGGIGNLLELLAAVLNGEGAALLKTLLRAQCGAGTGIPALARELREVLRQRAGEFGEDALAAALSGASVSQASLDQALARGFWTLPPDESGMHQREREAEKLLERARRELWVAGSASRGELEKQIQMFLCRYALGCAATGASLRVAVILPEFSGPSGTGLSQSEAALRQLRFAPAPGGLWCRLDLADLEVPME